MMNNITTCIKLQAIGSPHENLARHIFIALNEAHTIFEESGGQPLFWSVLVFIIYLICIVFICIKIIDIIFISI